MKVRCLTMCVALLFSFQLIAAVQAERMSIYKPIVDPEVDLRKVENCFLIQGSQHQGIFLVILAMI